MIAQAAGIQMVGCSLLGRRWLVFLLLLLVLLLLGCFRRGTLRRPGGGRSRLLLRVRLCLLLGADLRLLLGLLRVRLRLLLCASLSLLLGLLL